MPKLISLCLLLFLCSNFSNSQSYKILESNNERLKIEFKFGNSYQLKDTTFNGRVYQKIEGDEDYFRNPGEPWVPEYNVNIGIPFNSEPTLSILQVEKLSYENKFIIPFPEDDPQFTRMDVNKFDKTIYSSNKLFPENPAYLGKDFIMRYSRVIPLSVSAYQFNPVTHQLIFNKKVVVQINFNIKTSDKLPINDNLTNEFLKSSVLNYSQAYKWTGKEPSNVVSGANGYGNYWYNPNKNYFRIYLKTKGVYRITFDQLISSGVPIQGGVQSDKLEIINEGNSIPIDIIDGGDGMFNSGDYFQFIGGPPSPSPYSRVNIYNNTNVYWFSYESDTLAARYVNTDGYPTNYQHTLIKTLEALHFEKDTIYEPLGHSGTLDIDHWYWDKITGSNGTETYSFTDRFENLPNYDESSHYLKVKVNLTGMNSYNCSPDHKANFKFNEKSIGTMVWDGQSNSTFEKTLYISSDSIPLYTNGNYLTVSTKGEVCDVSQSDELRMNWYDMEYWRLNRTSGDHFNFESPTDSSGVIRFWLWQWTKDNMKVYIPSKSKLIYNPQIINDADKTVLFVDTVTVPTDYFCAASNYFLQPDSIKEAIPSDLRNPSNEADYIIITHPNFLNAAQRLKTLRENQYPDSNIVNPKIKIVDINEVYNEFSYGLLNPQALQDFVKYAFENWSGRLQFTWCFSEI